MTTTDSPRVHDTRTVFAPPSRVRDLLAEGLACITSGRPLPPELRPAPRPTPAVSTVAEGIARMLGEHDGAVRR